MRYKKFGNSDLETLGGWLRLNPHRQPNFQCRHFLDKLKKVDRLKEIAADRCYSVA